MNTGPNPAPWSFYLRSRNEYANRESPSNHFNKDTLMTSKAHLSTLSLVAATLAFSARPSSAAPAAPAPYVSIISANYSTPAFYNVPSNSVASVIYAREGTTIKITVNGVSATEEFNPIQGNSTLPTVTGPATITITATDNNGSLATIAVTPIAKTTTDSIPR
jgi:hypothetical protein